MVVSANLLVKRALAMVVSANLLVKRGLAMVVSANLLVKRALAMVVSAIGEHRFPNTVLPKAAAIVFTYTSVSVVRCTATGIISGNMIPGGKSWVRSLIGLLEIRY